MVHIKKKIFKKVHFYDKYFIISLALLYCLLIQQNCGMWLKIKINNTLKENRIYIYRERVGA